ncbi:tigger transposable element-derived protein 4-like [Branchiostoma floridae]|uniref:Tigger transposable element-derived protein 4-like n=1 Tax=Branchiostoma floridae TaxID=7739 RepID=A0A9J7MVH7_BRAFL|nr:tigger transposable element-derived protein 4-like [Branchiostoma floridae]
MAMASNTSSPKRKPLTLQQRVEVLRVHDQTKKSTRKLAEQFNCGKTQIDGILKRKREIMEEFENNAPLDRKRARTTGNEELNMLLWEWFKDATARKLPVSGPMLQVKALEFAKELGRDDFKASNGWLGAFRKRHNIKFGTMSGEKGDVSEEVTESWKERLPQICEGYDARDIFNMDESGLYYRASTDKTLYAKGDDCSGGKRSKDRVTIAYCANLLGEKEKPIVIGKSKNPRCFKNVDKDNLPVHYYNSRTAWMTGFIFEDWVCKFDRKLGRAKRKAILFLDNATCHPDLRLKNLKLVFFPPNTTSVLQPLDQGVIQTNKLKYRRRQLSHVLAKMDEDKTLQGPEILKSTNVLQAIYWISYAWNDVDPSTIVKCFNKAGFTVTEPQPPQTGEMAEEDTTPVRVETLCMELFGCELSELVEIDRELATCNNESRMVGTAAELLSNLRPSTDEAETSDEEDEAATVEQPAKQVSLREAGSCVETLKDMCLGSNYGEMLDLIMMFEAKLAVKCAESQQLARQSTIHEFFGKK